MSNDSTRGQLGDVVAGLRDQLADIAAVQQKHAALVVRGQAAEGSVEVTVNARGQLVGTVIDKSFLDEHDFDELGSCIAEAARNAAAEAARQVAEVIAPLNKRHKGFPSFSDIVDGMPDPGDVMPPGLDASVPAPHRKGPSASRGGGAFDDGDDGGAEFPTVRR